MEQILGPDSLRTVLGSVIRNNFDKWLRFILAILRNEADAEDVIQEAVRRVLARDLSFAAEDQVRMYLGRAIANAALELYNSRKRERLRLSPINELILLPANTSSPSACIEESERSHEKEQLLLLLDEGLKHLPPKQYEALRLTILESRGLSIRDAGASSGIPYSTLRHRSKQGLRLLRKFLRNRTGIQKIGGKKEVEVRIQKSEFRMGEDNEN
jgi:RNA polymerase sigma-70 factor (ECF subfamily)